HALGPAGRPPAAGQPKLLSLARGPPERAARADRARVPAGARGRHDRRHAARRSRRAARPPRDVAAVVRRRAGRRRRAGPRLRAAALRELTEQGVRFGKALQLTHVLRDVPGDLAHGRCYLPARELAALGLGPRDLLAPTGAGRARPLYRRLLGLALEHYDVAWSYTLAIPKLEWRMRLACAWPLLIGLATLAELAAH